MSGGRKDDGRDGTGKPKERYDLIPTDPLRKLAEVYTLGAKKYEDRNWERGMEWGRLYAALQRHANAWWGGEQRDPNDGQHHLASVTFCAFALMEFERTHPELDNRTDTGSIPKDEDLKQYDKLFKPQITDSSDDTESAKYVWPRSYWEGVSDAF
jgi:hypothetical protein